MEWLCDDYRGYSLCGVGWSMLVFAWIVGREVLLRREAVWRYRVFFVVSDALLCGMSWEVGVVAGRRCFLWSNLEVGLMLVSGMMLAMVMGLCWEAYGVVMRRGVSKVVLVRVVGLAVCLWVGGMGVVGMICGNSMFRNYNLVASVAQVGVGVVIGMVCVRGWRSMGGREWLLVSMVLWGLWVLYVAGMGGMMFYYDVLGFVEMRVIYGSAVWLVFWLVVGLVGMVRGGIRGVSEDVYTAPLKDGTRKKCRDEQGRNGERKAERSRDVRGG